MTSELIGKKWHTIADLPAATVYITTDIFDLIVGQAIKGEWSTTAISWLGIEGNKLPNQPTDGWLVIENALEAIIFHINNGKLIQVIT